MHRPDKFCQTPLLCHCEDPLELLKKWIQIYAKRELRSIPFDQWLVVSMATLSNSLITIKEIRQFTRLRKKKAALFRGQILLLLKNSELREALQNYATKEPVPTKTFVGTNVEKMRTNASDTLPIFEIIRKYSDEQTCIDYLIDMRWGGKPRCVYCGHEEKVYYLKSRKKFKCSSCRRQFSIRRGTVMQDSNLDLCTWITAFHILLKMKRNMPTVELARQLGISEKAAHFLVHRIQFMARELKVVKLNESVQIDETLIGGKEPNKHKDKKTPGSRGRSTVKKAGVMAVIGNKSGRVIARQIGNFKEKTVRNFANMYVAKKRPIWTDEFKSYRKLGREGYKHLYVTHVAKCYVGEGGVSTNKVENFWAQFKRQIKGSHIGVSKKHLQKYLDLFTFKFNNRLLPEREKCDCFLKERLNTGTLKYYELTGRGRAA